VQNRRERACDDLSARAERKRKDDILREKYGPSECAGTGFPYFMPKVDEE
jgi:hypothetical protein